MRGSRHARCAAAGPAAAVDPQHDGKKRSSAACSRRGGEDVEVETVLRLVRCGCGCLEAVGRLRDIEVVRLLHRAGE